MPTIKTKRDELRYYTLKYGQQILKIVAVLAICCLTKTTHIHQTLSQDVYIWQKKWNNSLKPAIEQTAPFISGWRFLAGEFEPDGKIIYPSIEFEWLQKTYSPLTAVYRFDRLRPLPTADEILSLIQQSPAYHIHHIRNIELDLDWPTSKLKTYIQLLHAIKQKLPSDVILNITMIPDWMRSPFFPELTQQIPHPVLQVHSVDNPQTGLFTVNNAWTYIHKMNQLTRHSFYVALPTYGLKVQMTPSGKIYAIEGENNFKTGKSGTELYSDPRQVRILIQKLQQNTPSDLKGIIWFRLPVDGDQRNWSLNTWMAMIRHQPLTGKIIIQETSDPDNPGAIKIIANNQGNIPMPLPLYVPLRCKSADGFFPYHLGFDDKGAYQLQLTQKTAPLNTNQKQVIGWMRCLDHHE